jgi:AcrR family transcriptional regulator
MVPNPPRRSDATRAAIRSAARDRFAAEGYDRATIRAIAADARIDPAMVMRYFGSKAQLFAAAADFDLHLPEVGSIHRADAGAAMVRGFLARWAADDTLVALLRAAASHPAAAERMRDILAEQITPAVHAFLGSDTPGDRQEISRRAGLIATQVLGFAYSRFVLELPQIVELDDDQTVAWLGPTLQRYLTGEAT